MGEEVEGGGEGGGVAGIKPPLFFGQYITIAIVRLDSVPYIGVAT